jgi:5-methylcytosine-specific restriction endonuclease McrA
VTRVTTLSERHALDCFWDAIRGHADKLHMLREMARVEVLRPDEWDRLHVRATADATTVMLFARECFCCGGQSPKLVWHHVIQVQHGGSNSAGNLVALCFGCHSNVHPWLVPQPNASRARGWFSPSDLMRQMWGRLERIFDHEQVS